jgi:serine phosphatase RsbU (regulator of sigma subunit)
MPMGRDKRSKARSVCRWGFPRAKSTLVPGDQVVFCTDGITDAENSKGESFGKEGLDKALSGCPVGAQAMVDSVINEIRKFTGNAPAKDDRTLLAAKFVATESKF